MTPAQLQARLCMSMDGVILTMPPSDPVDRGNYCHSSCEYMWRNLSLLDTDDFLANAGNRIVVQSPTAAAS